MKLLGSWFLKMYTAERRHWSLHSEAEIRRMRISVERNATFSNIVDIWNYQRITSTPNELFLLSMNGLSNRNLSELVISFIRNKIHADSQLMTTYNCSTISWNLFCLNRNLSKRKLSKPNIWYFFQLFRYSTCDNLQSLHGYLKLYMYWM